MKYSALQLALLFVALALAYALYCSISQARRSGLRDVPGPFVARFTNLILKWYVLVGKRTLYIHGLHGQYGPVVRISPTEVSFVDQSAIRVIYSISDDFPKAPWYDILSSQAQPGLFAMPDKQRHGVRRKLFAPAFSKSSVFKWEAQFKEKISIAITKMKRDAALGTADIFKWFTFMTTDIIGELAFGDSFDILSEEKKPAYIEDMETTLIIGGIRAELQFLLPIAKRLPIASLQHALAVYDRMRSYGQIAVNNARSITNVKPTIFSKMIHEGEGGKLLPDGSIADEAGNLMIAGSGTTAVTLTYLVWCVLRDSHVKQTLLSELQSCPDNPALKELESLPYLNAVINEALRLYTPAPGTMARIVPPTNTKLAGYYIPAGTTVGTQAYTIHRDPTVFPDPLKYDPSRWLKPTDAMLEQFMPWGLGARTCLGIHLAKLELLHAIFALFRECPDLKLAPTTTDASMDIEDYFLIVPIAHKCEVTL